MPASIRRVVWLGSFFVAAVSVIGCASNPSPPVSVSLTPSTPQALDQNAARSLQLTANAANDARMQGVTWSLIGPRTIASTISMAIYNPPTVVLHSAQQVTVTATSLADPTKTASLQITVNPYPAVPNQTLANGTVGVPYSQPVSVVGGTAPFQWGIYSGGIETGIAVGGSVPDGLMVDPTTGTISGTPTGAGTWYFEEAATDADNAFGFNGFLSIQINPAGPAAANPVPFLNQTLVPAAVIPGGNGTTLNVSGAGFVSASTIDFNGTPLTTTFIDGEHLSAILPATETADAQTASVTVVSPAPGGGASNAVYLQVGAPRSTVSFANARNSPLPFTEASGLAVGDFNEDGKPDLAVAANVRLYVLLSKGNGTFARAPNSPIPIPSPPYDDLGSPYVGPLAVGDFNNSGHPGLAVSELNNEAAVILLGNGSGSFTPSSATFANSPGQPTSAIAAADFNVDGNLDLLFVNSLLGVSLVELGYGKGAFTPAGELPGGFTAMAVGDFNGDGRLDVALAGGGVSLGNGDGTFAQPTGSPTLVGSSAIVAGDFNGDGKLDLASADLSGSAVSIQLGHGDGTFQSPITFPTGVQPFALAIGDFNNDGKLDIATTNYGDNTVTILLGNGNGTFTQSAESSYAVGRSPTAIVAADFNGDGKLDLAIANSADGTVSVLLQQ